MRGRLSEVLGASPPVQRGCARLHWGTVHQRCIFWPETSQEVLLWPRVEVVLVTEGWAWHSDWGGAGGSIDGEFPDPPWPERSPTHACPAKSLQSPAGSAEGFSLFVRPCFSSCLAPLSCLRVPQSGGSRSRGDWRGVRTGVTHSRAEEAGSLDLSCAFLVQGLRIEISPREMKATGPLVWGEMGPRSGQ